MLIANPFVENAGYKPPEDAIDPDLSAIPRGTELVCVVADIDSATGRLGCDAVVERTVHLKRRDYAWMYGDDHGEPPLVVSHRAPSIAAPDDPFDFFGFWKLGDALTTCSLDDRNCGSAIGGGPKQRYMGTWSDGVDVRKLDVFRSPPPARPVPRPTAAEARRPSGCLTGRRPGKRPRRR